jgi:tRNA-specific 2-thiouridylase
MGERVVVAMSGGVDSSVAAARLVAEGWDVVGVTLHLWDDPRAGGSAASEKSRCCAPEDQRDARRVADRLGFPHFVFDRRDLFRERVVEPFVDAYLAGRTPSPCVTCNEHVKVRQLVPLAERLGARFVATGHYARVVRGPAGRPELHRGRDRAKDQSYFLHVVSGEDLERLVLPLGELTKPEVRAEALRLGLPGATKGESQELCFVGGDYARFVEERAGSRARPGALVDEDGRKLGEHRGVHRFTIGQRKGLGVSSAEPLFVTALDAESGLVRLGRAAHAGARGASLVHLRLAEGVVASDLDELEVQPRYRATPQPARLRVQPCGSRATLAFRDPVRGLAPGQIAVLFRGDRVLGGGTIDRALPGIEAHEGPQERTLA